MQQAPVSTKLSPPGNRHLTETSPRRGKKARFHGGTDTEMSIATTYKLMLTLCYPLLPSAILVSRIFRSRNKIFSIRKCVTSYKFFWKEPTNMNAILFNVIVLHSNHLHVSPFRLAIFKVNLHVRLPCTSFQRSLLCRTTFWLPINYTHRYFTVVTVNLTKHFMILNCIAISTCYNCICYLVLITLKIPTWVVEICRLSRTM